MFSELPSELLPEVNELKKIYHSKSKPDVNLLIYDKQKILKLVDSIQNTRYSVKFNIQNQPYNVLYNLILGKDVYGKKQEPFIVKYTINNFSEMYLDNRYDFSKMKGSIAIYKYYPFLNYLGNLKKVVHKRTENGLIEDDPCSEHNNTGASSNVSGGVASGVDNSADSNSGDNGGNFVEFENPNSDGTSADGGVDCNLLLWYSNSSNDLGNLYSISWSCTDGTGGFADVNKSAKTDNLDCFEDGEVPVNEGEEELPMPPSCKSFNYSQLNNLNVQVSAVQNISFRVKYKDPFGNWHSSDVLFTQPIYFTTPRFSVANGGNLTTGRAADLSADALLRAHYRAKAYFIATDGSDSQVRAKLWEYIRDEMHNGTIKGGGASFNPPLGFTGNISNYQTTLIFGDKCN